VTLSPGLGFALGHDSSFQPAPMNNGPKRPKKKPAASKPAG
jgi:hypothetical protein